jgi:hypothetical protein
MFCKEQLTILLCFLGCLHDAILHMILQNLWDLGHASGIPFEISKTFFFHSFYTLNKTIALVTWMAYK